MIKIHECARRDHPCDWSDDVVAWVGDDGLVRACAERGRIRGRGDAVVAWLECGMLHECAVAGRTSPRDAVVAWMDNAGAVRSCVARGRVGSHEDVLIGWCDRTGGAYVCRGGRAPDAVWDAQVAWLEGRSTLSSLREAGLAAVWLLSRH